MICSPCPPSAAWHERWMAEPGDPVARAGASAKRKWFQLYGDAPTPPRTSSAAKRPTPSSRLPQQPSKDELRRELAAVYAAYDALFKSCKEGRGDDSDYLALLKAAEGESVALHRSTG